MLIFVVTLITSFAATSASPLNIYSEESRPVTDVVNTTSFFWYQADDGSVVKAYYEGGPTLNAKSSLHTVFLYHHTRYIIFKAAILDFLKVAEELWPLDPIQKDYNCLWGIPVQKFHHTGNMELLW